MRRISQNLRQWSLKSSSKNSIKYKIGMNAKINIPKRYFSRIETLNYKRDLNLSNFSQPIGNIRNLRTRSIFRFSQENLQKEKFKEENETIIIDEERGITSEAIDEDNILENQKSEINTSENPENLDIKTDSDRNKMESGETQKKQSSGKLSEKSRQRMEAEWMAVARSLEWTVPPTNALPKLQSEDSIDYIEKSIPNWFPGGQLNMAYNCLNHPKREEKTAISYFNEHQNKFGYLTYKQLRKRVNVMAAVLKELGVKQGDCVLLYLFNSVELVISALACMQIGAVYVGESVRFGTEHVKKIVREVKPKLVISMSCNGKLNIQRF